jgi:endonuclease/exonuclease/phosphatase family metal-dependent hydrolase
MSSINLGNLHQEGAMSLFRVGTYNVENLFDRFDDPYSVGDDTYGRFRAYPKSRSKLYDCGCRIRENGVPRQGAPESPYPIDIVALQEIENFGALLDFVQASVGPDYGPKTGVVSQPSNDPRGIDLGLIARTDIFRIGRVISHRFNKFLRPDGRTYQFGRDCLQVEILDEETRDLFLTVFICHFKSKYTMADRFNEPAKYQEEQTNNTLKRVAEANEVARIIRDSLDVEEDRFVVLGDLNDTPESEPLHPLLDETEGLGLHNALTLIDQDDLSPTSITRRPRDTHYWKRPTEDGGTVDEWAQIDYILCSDRLWELNTGVAKVINSPKTQGSDHYLSFAEFEFP